MEIDKAMSESEDRWLKTKYNRAIHIIQRALALYSIEEVAFSFNGGKDSTVLLHLLRAGYFLHKKMNSTDEDCTDFPIRTIYFESKSAFPEIDSFTHDAAESYGIKMDIIRSDFKSGLENLLKTKPIRAIFLGVRIGDPTAVGQEQFTPSSVGWPPFMRVNPILDWSYRDVWAFLLACKVKYCSLYDKGYTSIGSIHDTVPNALLSISNSASSKENFKPAYLLSDGRLERAGRTNKHSSSSASAKAVALNNGVIDVDSHKNCLLTASVIAVGDDILLGSVEDKLGPSLCKKLHSIGWSVSQTTVVRNDVDSVGEEVERKSSSSDMVFIYGGIGPLHSDVTLAGVAKAFAVRLAPDEEFEEYLRQVIGDYCPGDRNEMALLPEGITELLHHERLDVPLIKCKNVILLNATNFLELETQWDCLIELARSSSDVLSVMEPYFTRSVTSNLSDVVTAKPVSKLCLEFPDIHISCYRKTRYSPPIISFKGKDQSRLEEAVEALRKKFPNTVFSEVGSN